MIEGPKRLIQKLAGSQGYQLVNASRLLPGHLISLIERLSIDAVLDVGACCGEFGSMLRAAGYAGPIISFEPVSVNYAELAQRASSDRLWTAHHLALGTKEERLPIKVARATDFSSFLPLTPFGADPRWDAEIVSEEEVDVMPLERIFDDVLPSKNARPLLKTDTQGWDLEVLRGAGKTITRVQATHVEMSVTPIYEDSPHFMETMAFLFKRGFELTGLFPAPSEELTLIEFDCVMARSKRSNRDGRF